MTLLTTTKLLAVMLSLRALGLPAAQADPPPVPIAWGKPGDGLEPGFLLTAPGIATNRNVSFNSRVDYKVLVRHVSIKIAPRSGGTAKIAPRSGGTALQARLPRVRRSVRRKYPAQETCPSMNMNNRVHCTAKSAGRSERPWSAYRFPVFLLWLLSLPLCFSATLATAQTHLPKPDHVILVIEENKGYSQIIGSPSAPYLNALAKQGASFSNFLAFHHPSQPNYLEIFSGSNQNVWNDTCPSSRLAVPSLGGALLKAGLSFRGYAEDLPHVGASDRFSPTNNPSYARKHCPWIDFADVDPQLSQPLTAFPSRYETLPTLAFVIPNLWNDMHNGRNPQRITRADTWLQQHLGGYVEWAKTHNSLLIVTWDEDNHFRFTLAPNHIPTILVGPMIQAGVYKQSYNHHDLLRTLEEMYGLPLLGESKKARAITDVWISR